MSIDDVLQKIKETYVVSDAFIDRIKSFATLEDEVFKISISSMVINSALIRETKKCAGDRKNFSFELDEEGLLFSVEIAPFIDRIYKRSFSETYNTVYNSILLARNSTLSDPRLSTLINNEKIRQTIYDILTSYGDRGVIFGEEEIETMEDVKDTLTNIAQKYFSSPFWEEIKRFGIISPDVKIPQPINPSLKKVNREEFIEREKPYETIYKIEQYLKEFIVDRKENKMKEVSDLIRHLVITARKGGTISEPFVGKIKYFTKEDIDTIVGAIYNAATATIVGEEMGERKKILNVIKDVILRMENDKENILQEVSAKRVGISKKDFIKTEKPYLTLHTIELLLEEQVTKGKDNRRAIADTLRELVEDTRKRKSIGRGIPKYLKYFTSEEVSEITGLIYDLAFASQKEVRDNINKRINEILRSVASRISPPKRKRTYSTEGLFDFYQVEEGEIAPLQFNESFAIDNEDFFVFGNVVLDKTTFGSLIIQSEEGNILASPHIKRIVSVFKERLLTTCKKYAFVNFDSYFDEVTILSILFSSRPLNLIESISNLLTKNIVRDSSQEVYTAISKILHGVGKIFKDNGFKVVHKESPSKNSYSISENKFYYSWTRNGEVKSCIIGFLITDYSSEESQPEVDFGGEIESMLVNVLTCIYLDKNACPSIKRFYTYEQLEDIKNQTFIDWESAVNEIGNIVKLLAFFFASPKIKVDKIDRLCVAVGSSLEYIEQLIQ